jgi:hypothetical protein
MKCVNCGKDSKQLVDIGFGGFKLCQTCVDASKRIEDLLKTGIEVEYSDGTKETFRSAPNNVR